MIVLWFISSVSEVSQTVYWLYLGWKYGWDAGVITPWDAHPSWELMIFVFCSKSSCWATWWFIPRIVFVGYNPGYKWDKWGQCPLISRVISHLLMGWTNMCICIYGGFLSHRGTSSHHLFRDGFSMTSTIHHGVSPFMETSTERERDGDVYIYIYKYIHR